jgi:hypothetical protein
MNLENAWEIVRNCVDTSYDPSIFTALKLVEEKLTSTNTGNPKLLQYLELAKDAHLDGCRITAEGWMNKALEQLLDISNDAIDEFAKLVEEKFTSTNSKSMPLSCDECSAEMREHHSYCWNCGTCYKK